jgi:hypothetical protein
LVTTIRSISKTLGSLHFKSVNELKHHIIKKKTVVLKDTVALAQLVITDIVKSYIMSPKGFDFQMCRHHFNSLISSYFSLIPPEVFSIHTAIFTTAINILKAAVNTVKTKTRVNEKEFDRWGIHLTEQDLNRIGKTLK